MERAMDEKGTEGEGKKGDGKVEGREWNGI